MWAEIEVTGRAAHGSRPHLGVDAILKTGPILTALAALEHDDHPLLGDGSLHASLIEGGEELSSYPARCVLKLERRTLPGETAGRRRARARRAARRAAAPPTPTSRCSGGRCSSATRSSSTPRRSWSRSSATWSARAPGGVSYWADSAFIAAAGIPTVLLGPAGEGAHAAEEWVSIVLDRDPDARADRDRGALQRASGSPNVNDP